MKYFLEIVTKPDNIPIVALLFLVVFYTWFAFKKARKNDSQELPEEAKLDDKIQVWPNLVRVEFLGTLIVFAILAVWSITIDAPLEEPANPTLTPNPSKAPWYFLGLQELLVYFDPWIAGVILPSIIIVGLMAIPYIDINPKGNGYYTFKERKFAILTYYFGFLILWVALIILGTFLRGPGWNFFLPWEYWDPHKVVVLNNVDLSEMIGIPTKNPDNSLNIWATLFGFSFVSGFFGILGAWHYNKFKKTETYKLMGPIRYWTTSLLFWGMAFVVLKIILRLLPPVLGAYPIKYVWVTPWFNI
ncbi:MAG: cytochrome C [Bacteroidetes bacterium]|nr:cytochrome C [Bacteroidota bacterium]